MNSQCELLFEEGYRFARSFQFARAGLRFEQAFRLCPDAGDDADMVRVYGWFLTNTERVEQAEEYMRRAVELRPCDPQVWADLVNFYLWSWEFEQARQVILDAESRNCGHRSLTRAQEECELIESEVSKDYDLFISYKSEDVLLARRIVERLMASGLRVWFAEYEIALADRDKFNSRIVDGIKRSRYGLIITNKEYGDSLHCRHELQGLMTHVGLADVLRIMYRDQRITRPHFPAQALEDIPRQNCLVYDGPGDFPRLLRLVAGRIPFDIPAENGGGPEMAAERFTIGIDQCTVSIQTGGWGTPRDRTGEAESADLALEDPRCWDIAARVSRESIPRRLPSLERALLERMVFDQLTERARVFLRDSSVECRGVHLVFLGGFCHLAVTVNDGDVWARRYHLVLPLSQFEQNLEVSVNFHVRGSFSEFCRRAAQMDEIVASLRWSEETHAPREWFASAGEAIAVILSELDDVRILARAALGGPVRTPGACALELLRGGLSHPNREVRLQSLSALMKIGDKAREVVGTTVYVQAAVDACLAFLGDPDVKIRRAALEWLGRLAPLPVHLAPRLLEVLLDLDEPMRALAIRQINAMEPLPASLLHAIDIGLVDESNDVRLGAATAICRLLKAANLPPPYELLQTLCEHLARHGLTRRTRSARRLLKSLGEPVSEFVEQALAEKGSDMMRRGAVLALVVASRGSQALQRLVVLLKSEDAGISRAACEAIAYLGAKARAARPVLQELGANDPDEGVRQAAHDALMKTAPLWDRFLCWLTRLRAGIRGKKTPSKCRRSDLSS
ncbi:MAG TPA: HEAT repeat domain-containing protein [Thermoguttaceae bacterium]|nr:HEAT repeat domain-containing protein [Thermoguttaceae bacterium]